jgi:ferredoxin
VALVLHRPRHLHRLRRLRPECPYEAIFPEDEVPEAYTMKPGQVRMIMRAPGDIERYEAKGGEVVNLREDIPFNYKFYKEGPGYNARNM